MSIKLDGNTFLTGPDLSAGGYSGTKLILHGWFRAGDDTPIQGYLVRESGGAVGHLWLRQETSGNLVFQCETSGGAVIATLNGNNEKTYH